VIKGLHERRPARPESIAPLRRAVVRFAYVSGASTRKREDIALAVTEAVSNAVVHAYDGEEAPGDVAVEARLEDETLEVVVCDEGHGMRARVDSPGLGLGLMLIRRTADRLQLERLHTRSGVRVRMTFALN
jgi:serine/threonine-protein kinase RsbW